MTITRCECGKRMSRYSNKCRSCAAQDAERFQARIARVNEAIAKGGVYRIETAFGSYVVSGFNSHCDAMCFPADGRRDYYSQRTFALHGGHIIEAAKVLGIA